jgi:hypothetical protein
MLHRLVITSPYDSNYVISKFPGGGREMVYESELIPFPPGRVAAGVIAFCSLNWAGLIYLLGQAVSV